MRITYAVTWEDRDHRCSGRLEFGARGLRLDGGNENGAADLEIPYDELAGVSIGRDPEDRLDGRPTLILERRVGGPVAIASIAQPGIVAELAERVVALYLGRRGAASRALVVLPLQEGAHKEVRRLLEHGPPFDPEQAHLERHLVFLTDREAVFLFEAESKAALTRLAGKIDLLAAAEAWREHASGPARLAEEEYSWVSPRSAEGLSFAATPGPGDSEGGNLYPPVGEHG